MVPGVVRSLLFGVENFKMPKRTIHESECLFFFAKSIPHFGSIADSSVRQIL